MCCLCVQLKSNQATWQLNPFNQKIVGVIIQHLKFSSVIVCSRAFSGLSLTARPQTFQTLSTHLSSQVCVRNKSVTQDYGLLSNLSCLGKRPVALIPVPQATQQMPYMYMYVHMKSTWIYVCVLYMKLTYFVIHQISPRWFEGCRWAICSPWTTKRKRPVLKD